MQQITTVSGVNVNEIYRNLGDLVNQLKLLNVTKEEIISDIYTTILICRKDFNPTKGSKFFKYLYTAIRNNFNRKIYAIRQRYLSERCVHENMSINDKGPAERALSELPEILSFLNGEIDIDSFRDICTENDKIFNETINELDDYLPQ